MMSANEQASTLALVDTNDGVTPASRRRWPEELKRRMVEESRAPGASVSVVARRYDVNANQLFKWRRQYEASSSDRCVGTPGVRLVPVALCAAEPAPVRGGTLEVDLPCGARIRAIGVVDAGLLGQVLAALR
jgi:transposase